MNLPISDLSDFGQYAQLRAGARSGDAQTTAEVAKQFETLFAEQMLKSMREASGESDALFPGNAKQFREMYDHEIVKSLTSRGGFGLAAQIERSLLAQQGLPLDRESVASSKAFSLDGYERRMAPLMSALNRASTSVAAAGANPTGEQVPDADIATLPVARSAPSSSVPTRRLTSPEAFVRAIWPYAEKAAQAIGVDPRMLVAQAALETGWGKHVPKASDGDSGNNLFGIKSSAGWQGGSATHQTQEFVNGRMQSESASFRTYDSLADSFADYVSFLQSNPRYQSALKVAGNGAAFAQALQRSGYATDPAYAKKLTAIAQGPRLNQAIASLQAEAPALGAAGLPIRSQQPESAGIGALDVAALKFADAWPLLAAR
ncbi:MAG: flagellar assembly peptidoglycan hydrolase FlgJ [Xanthomonadales bacterium]|nr:flagellar assembly peptidoglycan hydrolase FlgJ [Xanthomonadales bacterium]